MVLLLSLVYLKDNVMISESQNISYVDDSDIIGYINIKSIGLFDNLLQGLDNSFYLSHNYLKEYDKKGEIYLDYQGDLLNNNNSIIYANINKFINLKNIDINDKINIYYINDLLCYKVVKSKKDSNLELKIYDNNKKISIFAKKIAC